MGLGLNDVLPSFIAFYWTEFFGSVIKWFGHNLIQAKVFVLAPMDVKPFAGVNLLYASKPSMERSF
jgi:hypothetical protein